MKILHVIGSMDPSSGGPCQGIRNSIPVSEDMEFYREVASMDGDTAAFLGKDNFPVHALGPGRTSWGYTPHLLPWLLDNLERFDYVVVNGLWLYHGYAVRKALKILQKRREKKARSQNLPKVFVMPHGMLDPYFQKAAHRKLKAVRNWFYWKLIEGKVVNEAEGVLFTCETELLLARKTFIPYTPKREVNVGYGVPEPPAYTDAMREKFLEKLPSLINKPFLLFLSRIHDKKGVDILVSAYISVVKSKLVMHPTAIIPTLVVAGPGIETTYGKYIQKLSLEAADLGFPIIFPGMLAGDLKWGAFYGCEAFVLPSHQENFGIAVVEALACGKPVLISDQVNIWREIIEAGGGLVDQDTGVGIDRLFQKWFVLSDVEKQNKGLAARRAFEINYAIEPAVKRLVAGLLQAK